MNKLWFVIFGLTAIIVFIILFDKDPPAVDLASYERAMAISDLKIDSLTKSNRATVRRIQEDSILQAEEKQAYQKSITGLQARLRTKRERIDTLWRDNPALREYVATADSVISFQSARINSLEIDKAELRVDVKTITDNFLRQIEQHEVKLKATEQLAEVYKKDLRKQRRKTRLATIFGFGGTVGAFLLAQ